MERTVLVNEIRKIMSNKGLTAYAVVKNNNKENSSALYNAMNTQEGKECPKVETLEKICDSLGISLCRLFEFTSKEDEVAHLSEDEWKLINKYRSLPKDRADMLMAYVQAFIDAQDK